MNLLLLFKILFLPVLLPLSVVYGFSAFLYKIVSSMFSYKAKHPVVSVGNFCVGGSGKTPLVVEISKHLKEKGFSPVVVCKSYKASLKEPSEVPKEADPLVYGDEAVLLKETLEEVSIVSGPVKHKSIEYFDGVEGEKRVYILDDGAQHHKIHKDVKIHVWDMTRNLIDIFPFPLGSSREFWFLGEKPTISILNRFSKKTFITCLVRGDKIKASYFVNRIENVFNEELLSTDFTLISGLGNFKQLKSSVSEFVKDKPFSMKSVVEGKDHDDFLWFKASPGEIYVCTQKDKAKLVDRISPDSLYIVKSDYNEYFKEKLYKSLDHVLKGIL